MHEYEAADHKKEKETHWQADKGVEIVNKPFVIGFSFLETPYEQAKGPRRFSSLEKEEGKEVTAV